MNGRLISYSLESLAATLPGGVGNDELTAYLRQADWVIFNLLDAPPGDNHTAILHRFIAERQDLLRDKQVIVFAFNAPYYLDSTEISKLSAYYCLYGKTAPYVDVAARLLFRELTPGGVLPVSVPGIGYDLLSFTAPDPDQIIQISLEPLILATSAPDTTLEPTATPNFHIGDTVSIRTGTILDHNGHPVPDGTGVRFNITTGGDNNLIRQLETTTQDGIAVASFTIDREGVLEVRAESEPARTSVVLQLSVVGGGLTITIVAPTPDGGVTPVPGPVETPVPQPESPFAAGRPGVLGWFLLIAVLLLTATPVYLLIRRWINLLWGVRSTLAALLGGLIVYLFFALGIPPAKDLLAGRGWIALAESLLIGVLAGVAGAAVWYAISRQSRKK
jgi:beta-N-acetylhexosaminidase